MVVDLCAGTKISTAVKGSLCRRRRKSAQGEIDGGLNRLTKVLISVAKATFFGCFRGGVCAGVKNEKIREH